MLDRLVQAIPKFETSGTAGATTGPGSNPDFRRGDEEDDDDMDSMNSQSSDGSGSLEPITPPGPGLVPNGLGLNVDGRGGDGKDVGGGKDGGASASIPIPPARQIAAADGAANAPTGAGAGSARPPESATGAGGGTSAAPEGPGGGGPSTIDGRQSGARRRAAADDPGGRGQESGEGTSEARPAQSNLGASLDHYHQRLQSPGTTRPESRMSIASASSGGRPGNGGGDAMSETEDFADPIAGGGGKVGDASGAY